MRSTHDINAAIRRHATGSIDIDIYRTEATLLRGHAMRDAHALRVITVGALVLAGVLGFAAVVSSSWPPAVGIGLAAEISTPSQTH